MHRSHSVRWCRSISLTLLAVAACGDGEPAGELAVLVRRDREPAGVNCALGGTALRTGRDRNRDGTLGDAEVESTTYVCDAAGPAVVTREQPIAPGAQCPGGGVAVQAGLDDNGNGQLEAAEVDHTTVLCNSLELWRGDFTQADWADPVKVAALQGARVVEGSLTIDDDAPVALPALELVTGNLAVSAATPEVAFPALREVAGNLAIDAAELGASALARLEQVAGSLSITSAGAQGAGIAVEAPALREVRGDLTLAGAGDVALPALRQVGRAVRVAGKHRTLQLDALSAIGGVLSVTDQALTAVALPLLSITGGVHVASTPLVTVSLPKLFVVTANVEVFDNPALTAFDVHDLDTISGTLLVTNNPALVTLPVATLFAVDGILDAQATISIIVRNTGLAELAFPQLQRLGGGIVVVEDPVLRNVELPMLSRARSIAIQGHNAVEALRAPELTALDSLQLQGQHTLVTVDLGKLAHVTDFVELEDTALSDLSGFSALTTIGSLAIFGGELRDLRGMAQLQQVGSLLIGAAGALTSLDGLEAIRSIAGDVSLSGNGALVNTLGLANLTAIGGSLTVSHDPALASLDFPTLTRVGGDVRLEALPGVPPAQIAELLHRLGR
jgi:hypothetical protein